MNEKCLASSPSAVIESTAEQMGFQPVESAVVVALVGRTVAFCARMDLVDAVEASTSVTPALDSTGADGVLLVGYSQRPEWAARVLHTLASGVLDGLAARNKYKSLNYELMRMAEGLELITPESVYGVTKITYDLPDAPGDPEAIEELYSRLREQRSRFLVAARADLGSDVGLDELSH